jgi:hypothetical protein
MLRTQCEFSSIIERAPSHAPNNNYENISPLPPGRASQAKALGRGLAGPPFSSVVSGRPSRKLARDRLPQHLAHAMPNDHRNERPPVDTAII